MSQADFQVFRTHQDEQLRQRVPSNKRRFKQICRLWGALGDRAAKQAEAARIRAIAAAVPAANNAVSGQPAQNNATVTGTDPAAGDIENDAQNNTGNDDENDDGNDDGNGGADDEENEDGTEGGNNVGNDDSHNDGNDDEADAAAAAAAFLQEIYNQQAVLPDPVVLSNRRLSVVRAPTHQRLLKRRLDEGDQHGMREQRKRRKVDFLRNDIGLGEGWVGAGCPATASLNLVGVWVHVDEHGWVDDRVVVKDSYVPPETWTSLLFWSGDVTDASKREPVESAVLKRLKTHANDPNPFIELRKNQINLSYRQMYYRLYFAYLPFIDGQAMLDHYVAREEFFPEPWLWSVFEALIRAALIMEQGNIDAPVDGWKQLIHRDLKPANVFFDHPHTDIYPVYPYPKVGDFGFTLETSRDDIFNPQGYKSEYGACGTPGFIAPENFVWMNKDTRESVDNFQILSSCNVWGIGATMYTLITGYQPPIVSSVYLMPSLDDHDRWLVETGQDVLPYNHILMRLVTWCLNYVPKDRPSPKWLLDQILLVTGAVDPDSSQYAQDLAQGFRQRGTLPAVVWGHRDNIMHPEMFWQLGLSRDVVQERRDRDVNALGHRYDR